MPSPLDQKPHDLGLLYVPPASQSDPRVPLPEEFSLAERITISAIRKARQPSAGWIRIPDFSFTSPRTLALTGGQLITPTYPDILSLTTQITLPLLPSASTVVKEEDRVYLVAFAAQVGAAQDPLLGQVNFQYRDVSSQQVSTTQKENARRYRAFWVIIFSSNPVLPTDFVNALATSVTGDRQLTISDTTDAGAPLSAMLLYAKDPNLVQSNVFSVLPETVEVTEICRVRRQQNYQDRGYTWGFGGETNLSPDFNLLVTSAPKGVDIGGAVYRRAIQIFSGTPGLGRAFTRSIQNLTAGQVAGNPGGAGESAGSMNGSVCLSNDQRVTFTNQAFLQNVAVQVVTAGNDGNGRGLLTTSLNTNSPNGSYFSPNKADHKIYAADGSEQSSLGSFSNLGGTGALIWTADANSAIKPGSQAYFVPGVNYPAGSGLSLPFRNVEKVWLNGAALDPANLLAGDRQQDLTAYQDPAASGQFIVVTGAERAAIHYIYKAVTVLTDSNGTAVIPNGERGCFAFINGVVGRVGANGLVGRIDAPVCTGLTPNTAYKALIYYPPRSQESWQLQLSYCEYQGTALLEPAFLEGAVVASRALCFIHTQGGGGSVFQSEASVRFSPIAMHLPYVSAAIAAYLFDAPVQIAGEQYPGPSDFREIAPMAGAGLALPAPGQVLHLVSNQGIQPRSLNAALTANGQPIGFRTPSLASKTPFQAVLAFAVRQGEEMRLVMLTHNGTGNENVWADSSQGTGIDTFRM